MMCWSPWGQKELDTTEQLNDFLGLFFIKHIQRFQLFCGRNRAKHICSIFLEIYFEIQIWGDFKIVIGCTVVLHFSVHQNFPENLLKHSFLSSSSRYSDGGNVGQGLEIYISNKSWPILLVQRLHFKTTPLGVSSLIIVNSGYHQNCLVSLIKKKKVQSPSIPPPLRYFYPIGLR